MGGFMKDAVKLFTQTSHTDKVFCTLKIQYFSQ